MITCKIFGCRFNDLHISEKHECGKCFKYGHGQIECPMNNKMIKLTVQEIVKDELLKIRANKLQEFVLEKYINPKLQPNYFTREGLGMGHTCIVRNNNNVFQYVIFSDTDNESLYKNNIRDIDLPMIKYFINGYKTNMNL